MTKIKALAAAVAVALMPGAARAISTMQMLEWCQPVVNATISPDGRVSSLHTFESGFCWGAFIFLDASGYIYTDVPSGKSILNFCRPFSATEDS
jgi:hypothetical protein